MTRHFFALTLIALLVGCDGSLEDKKQGEGNGPPAVARDMDTGTSNPDSSDASAPLEDQGRVPGTAGLQIERRGAFVAQSEVVDLGAFKVGAPGCETFTLRNTGEVVIPLELEVVEGAITLGEAVVPGQIEAMGTRSFEVCVDTSKTWAGQATVRITGDLLLKVMASVEGAGLLAMGARVLLISSDLGKTWGPVQMPKGLDTVRGAIWAKGKVWLFGEGASPLHTSEDGRTWQAVEVGGAKSISGLAYGQDKFMGVHGRAILHSEDGLTWTEVPDTVPDGTTLLDIAWAAGRFVAVGDIVVAISEDGQTWRSKNRGGNVTPITRVVSNGEWFAQVQDYAVRVSEDGDQWRGLAVCQDKARSPSEPIFGPGGVMFSWCEGSLFARSLTGTWRRVGRSGVMPTPLLYAQGALFGVDDMGGFWSSPMGLEWTKAEGGAMGIERILSMGEPQAAERPPEAKACGGGELKCIDFEQEMPTLPPLFQFGLKAGVKNVVAVDETFAFSGKRSMRVDAFAGESGQRGMIAFEKGDFDPLFQSKIYARMMFFTPAYPVRNWHMSETSGPLSKEDTRQVQYNAGGDGARAFHNYYGAGKDCWNKSAYTYPVNQWFCWQIEYDKDANRMVISVDGKEVHRMDGRGQDCLGAEFDGKTVWQAPEFTRFNIGFNPFKTQEQDLTAWIDDVVVDTKPTTCPSKP